MVGDSMSKFALGGWGGGINLLSIGVSGLPLPPPNPVPLCSVLGRELLCDDVRGYC